ncbi:MAG: hypothetical protein KAX93_01475 [Flavobacterium sp.]|nr:hypothetical protein [Flavobacterium sp.]MBP8157026.1 hypothetical protein [Flavobacterium sp.]
MKNFVTLFFIVTNAISFNCLAQNSERYNVDFSTKNTKLITDRILQKELYIVSYHVVEKINMKFGSTTTTYTVSDINLINTNDLGENNKRIITPKYARARMTYVYEELENAPFVTSSNSGIQAKVDLPVSEKRKAYTSVNVLETYERVLENGYFSVEMLEKVGDWHYFEGDLDLAAKWYAELFCMTPDLEATFYYRYAKSLAFIGQTAKAIEMMAIFESKKERK